MDEETLKQHIAELIESTGQAIGIVVSALARRQDAAQLTADLRATIAAAEIARRPPLAIRLAKHALAAAEGERLAQQGSPGKQ